MKIALDYDGTYTADPHLWNQFIQTGLFRGHDIRIVTHRHKKHDKIPDIPFTVPVIYTDGVAKKWFCEHKGAGWSPDVWIDDRPQTIFENGPLSLSEIAEWRLNRGDV